MTIKVPPLVTRPTSDRVKEAIFSMLGGSMEGTRVLDLFSGSGALGLESLSRGAEEAVFIEQHSGAAAVVESNLTKTKLKGGKVIKAEVFATLKRLAESKSTFNVIFADPPYAKRLGDVDYAAQLLACEHLHAVLAKGGFFVLETMVTRLDGESIPNWGLVRDRKYGSTRVLILQSLSSPDGEISGSAAP